MARKEKTLAALAKIETTYGTDSTPTGGANALLLSDAQFTPLAGEQVSRDLLLPYLGHQGESLVGDYVQFDFSVEIAGAGAAGDVPAYGPLLRGCGMAETVNAGTSVVYDPISSDEESLAMYFNLDGVNHILLGARGDVSMSFVPKQIPRFRFSFKGLVGTIADTALPTVDVSAFIKPLPVSDTNTPTYTLHGVSPKAESITIALGNTVEPRHLVGGESIEITDRKMTGTTVIENPLLAVKNWFAAAQAETRAAMQLVHGKTAGNIVQFDAPKVQLGRPTQGATQGIANLSIPLMMTPDSGDDDYSITVK